MSLFAIVASLALFVMTAGDLREALRRFLTVLLSMLIPSLASVMMTSSPGLRREVVIVELPLARGRSACGAIG